MKALSFTQPWLAAILSLGKRIENRSRRDGRMPSMCRYRGPLLLHASSKMTTDDYLAAERFCRNLDMSLPAMSYFRKPHPTSSREACASFGYLAGIVGRCSVVGHVEPWECDRCDGCGSYEGGAGAILTHCEACNGSGRVGHTLKTPPGAPTLWAGARHEQISAADARWWMGGYALVLADVEPLPFVACKGALGLWTVPADVLEALGLSEDGWRMSDVDGVGT